MTVVAPARSSGVAKRAVLANDVRVSPRDTPLLPSSIPPRAESRATLTFVTGMHAGRSVTIDAAPLTIGRDPGSDLVIEDEGVSRKHARIARAADGAFRVEDQIGALGCEILEESLGNGSLIRNVGRSRCAAATLCTAPLSST
jgi:type III secretion system (T3SS) inner membrane Yop/YscD-like protein